jgi:hemoglobin
MAAVINPDPKLHNNADPRPGTVSAPRRRAGVLQGLAEQWRLPFDRRPAADRSTVDTSELLKSIGGPDGVERTVEDLYRRLLDDPLIASYFDGIELTGVRQHMRDLLIGVLGGLRSYRGRDLAVAHTYLNITDDAFDRTVSHLLDALESHGMTLVMIDQVVLELAALRPLITANSRT